MERGGEGEEEEEEGGGVGRRVGVREGGKYESEQKKQT